MSSLEHFDLLIGESLERLVEAVSEIKTTQNSMQIDSKQISMKIGKTVSELWAIRDTIYRVKPELKRDFVKEHEQNPLRYEELDQLYQKAYKYEKEADLDSAHQAYKELHKASRFGYFRLIAEAGLFRSLRR